MSNHAILTLKQMRRYSGLPVDVNPPHLKTVRAGSDGTPWWRHLRELYFDEPIYRRVEREGDGQESAISNGQASEGGWRPTILVFGSLLRTEPRRIQGCPIGAAGSRGEGVCSRSTCRPSRTG
jgi:hypothetical protein